MKKFTSLDIASKLMQGGFDSQSNPDQRFSDPLADTPMILSLDRLRPYEHNPRMNKNPIYEELKASIRERGLGQSPGVTRRPGEEFYIIRDGGNTRLQILNELWNETRDEQFRQIHCLFRPWTPRGELVALTGHLAENDMHGALTFIERALGVDQARQMYEVEANEEISQRELARRLKADGYPISNSHISRMQEAIRYLLPAIPTKLHQGLGIDQITKITAMRKSMALVWGAHVQNSSLGQDFDDFFQDTLSTFDSDPEPFTFSRVQDELLGQMSSLFGVDYGLLELDLSDVQNQNKRVFLPAQPEAQDYQNDEPERDASDVRKSPEVQQDAEPSTRSTKPKQKNAPVATATASSEATVRLGKGSSPEFEERAVQAWILDGAMENADDLRLQAAQLASEIAIEVGLPGELEVEGSGAGFKYRIPKDGVETALSPLAISTRNLLETLCGNEPQIQNLGSLLLGISAPGNDPSENLQRLSDEALLKLFRLIRVSRRLVDLKN